MLVGFSAGALSSLLAAHTLGVVGYVGLDPFDRMLPDEAEHLGLAAATHLWTAAGPSVAHHRQAWPPFALQLAPADSLMDPEELLGRRLDVVTESSLRLALRDRISSDANTL